MTALAILAVAVLAALGAGILVRRNEGRVRESAPKPAVTDTAAESPRLALLAAAGVVPGRPAVLHFSADWCGPCAAVRRVVSAVVAELATAPAPPLDIEVDIDANPDLARELNVLSLPTTFLFDSTVREMFRISGVPKAVDLRTSLAPLTVSGAAE
ncbi:thioredoxin family protein [Nocardia jejuensis]|uniref:thioredoxin family protein n=1 Tax=Nocardia jejuensis TaxID=328049 RepID=UPI00082F3F10|nr:thioredoxin family protein [Nocardia jejuensis]